MEGIDEAKEGKVLKLNQKALGEAKNRKFEKAVRLLQEAKGLCSSRYDEFITLNNLASVFKKTGDLAKAAKYCLECVEIMDEFNDYLMQGTVYLNLASILNELGKYEKSEEFVARALKVLDKCPEKGINVIKSQIIAKSLKAHSMQKQDKTWQAIKGFKEAWEQAKEFLGTGHDLTRKLRKSLKDLCCIEEAQKSTRLVKSFTRTKASTREDRRPTRKTPSCRPSRWDLLPSIPGIESFRKKSAMSLTENKRENLIRPQFDSLYIKKDFEISKARSRVKIENEKIEGLNKMVQDVENDLGRVQDWVKDKARDQHKLGKASKGIENIAEFKRIAKNEENFNLRTRIVDRSYGREEGLRKRAGGREVGGCRKVLEERNKELQPVPVRSKICFGQKVGLGVIFESRSEDLNDFAVVVQNFMKMAKEKRRFLRVKKAAGIIQRNVRMFLVKSCYGKIKNAAVFIQAVFRGHRVRKLLRFL